MKLPHQKITTEYPLSKSALGIVLALGLVRTTLAASPTELVSMTPESPASAGDSLSFDNDFLSIADGKAAKKINLSYFTHQGGMAPGSYQVQVKINQQIVADDLPVTFKALPDTPWKLYACVPLTQLNSWGIAVNPAAVKTTDLPEKLPQAACPTEEISQLIPYASEHFDFNKRILSYSIPQAAMLPPGVLRTSPSTWQSSVPAVMMNYTANGTKKSRGSGSNGSYFLGFTSQTNILDWRIRFDGTWHKDTGQYGHWNGQNLYAQHDYAWLTGGQFTLGQTTTDGSIIDSVPFIGLMAASDEGMLRQENNYYSPTISGIAHSNATVIVSQLDQVIYQTNVAAGPFEIRDFNAGSAGDIQVDIKESDGKVQHLTLAASTLPNLVRKGHITYSTAAGRYQDGNGWVNPDFLQGNLAWGMSESTSLFTGSLLAKNYQSLAMGIGQYQPWLGSIAYSVTGAQTQLPDILGLPHQSGISQQLAWSRNLGAMSVSASGQFYGNTHYYSFSDVQGLTPNSGNMLAGRLKSRYQFTLSQPLDEWGSLSFSGSRDEYWQRTPPGQHWLINYSTQIRTVSVGLSAGYSTYPAINAGPVSRDKSLALSLSVPLGDVNANYLFSTDDNGQTSHQVGVSGSLLNNQVNYSVSQGWNYQRNSGNRNPWGQSGNINLGYNGEAATVNAFYSNSTRSESLSYGLRGGLLLHPHGVVFTHALTFDSGTALVDLGVPDVAVQSSHTNWQGYAVVSGLVPYDHNKLAVNVADLPGNIELPQTTKNVTPRRGGVVPINFKTQQGYRLFVTLVDKQQQPLPFGAIVALQEEDGPHTGVVSENGQAYLSGLPAKGTVTVSWGEGINERCQAPYQLPANSNQQVLQQLTLTCH